MVKLFANLRRAAGTKEVIIQGENISELLNALVDRYPDLALLLADTVVQKHLIITLNGQPVIERNTAVSEQDEIAIFPPLGGG